MKPDQLYEHLKEVLEKMGVSVSEQNLKTSGIPVRSGYCKVKGQQRFIIDKHLRIHQKNRILASFLQSCTLEDTFIPPKVREFIQSQK
jgi:hypothetical protein